MYHWGTLLSDWYNVPKFVAALHNPSTFRQTKMTLSAVAFCVIYDALPVASPGLCRIGLAGQLMRSTHCVWGGEGERGTNMAAAGIFRWFLCVHFVLAAHVVALHCGKLSTQQAACSKQHAASSMWHADWRKASQAFTSILSCALQSFGTVHDNLCLILPIKPLHAHCESNRALVWP